jgi:hypothetical protein
MTVILVKAWALLCASDWRRILFSRRVELRRSHFLFGTWRRVLRWLTAGQRPGGLTDNQGGTWTRVDG